MHAMRWLFLGVLLLSSSTIGAQVQVSSPVRMLALGDSYTIGQSVPASERWPEQWRDSLTWRGVVWDTLDVIATTGWRTDNLISAMNSRQLDSNYNLVSLLIGVNNQFQGGDTATYAQEFAQLLGTAIGLAGGNREQVVVLSIPDYAYTPYGQSSNPAAISAGVDQFNAINKRITEQRGVTYLNITPISREGIARPALVAGDGLHPSGLQYSEWVALLLDSTEVLFPTTVSEVSKAALSIHPNPAVGEVTIVAPAGGSIRIWNGQGRLVSTSATGRLSVTDWPTGIYFVEWKTDRHRAIKKLLVQ